MAELFLEIFCEEIPARMHQTARLNLYALMGDHLKAAGFSDFEIRDNHICSTPRRLVVAVNNLPIQQPDRMEEIKGPRVDAPEQALSGFMQANGLKSLDGVKKREIGKATHYFITRHEKGRATTEVLPEIIQQILQKFPWPKSMRWGSGSAVWVRPLHAVNVIFDGKVIMGNGAFHGHRFLSPAPFTANNFEAYKAGLNAHHVILDQGERRTESLAQAEKLAAQQNLTLQKDDAFEKLLDEVNGLVEWPSAMLGSFEKEYLAVPQECLIATMRANQKYFPLFDANGKLSNHFIVIANVPGICGGKEIVSGNERVLRARLSDAKFFYDQDLKTPLATRTEKLKAIQFHEKLGTLYERVGRIAAIAKKLATQLKADEKLAPRAAELCKSDLVTGMVGEFPELQGIMGRYYALAGGEDAAVADAIRDHYQPLGPHAAVPTAPISIILALAEKLDSLNEFFRINEKPTGSKDPYALRRAALGIIRIILENKITLPLSEFVQPDVLEFIKDRLQVALRDQGISAGQVRACLNIGDDLLKITERATALQQLVSQPVGESLLATYRRAANILKAEEKKDGKTYAAAVDANSLTEAAEKTLTRALADTAPKVQNALAANDNNGAAQALAALQPALDGFFADVMVNADDAKIRANRLNLLGEIRSVCHQFADFSQLEG